MTLDEKINAAIDGHAPNELAEAGIALIARAVFRITASSGAEEAIICARAAATTCAAMHVDLIRSCTGEK